MAVLNFSRYSPLSVYVTMMTCNEGFNLERSGIFFEKVSI